MRYQGKIIKWHDDKGYGFIRATEDSKDVFLHVSDIHNLKRRPEANELVTYELSQDNRGRFRASNVSYQENLTNLNNAESQASYSVTFLLFIIAFCVFVAERIIKGFLPVAYIFILIGANLLIFLYYYQDKTSAIKRNWRTPETKLHMLSLAGGWAGAYIAQKIFNHKHKKKSFMLTYKLTVLLNCLAITLFSLPTLQSILITYVT